MVKGVALLKLYRTVGVYVPLAKSVKILFIFEGVGVVFLLGGLKMPIYKFTAVC